MIKTQIYSIDEEGNALIRTYSDQHMRISQDETGIIYDEAIDPEFTHRTYTETDIPIEEDEENNQQSEAEEILNILLGGEE